MSALDRFAAIGSIGGWLTLNLALNVRGGLHARRGQTRCSALSVPDYSVFVLQTPLSVLKRNLLPCSFSTNGS